MSEDWKNDAAALHEWAASGNALAMRTHTAAARGWKQYSGKEYETKEKIGAEGECQSEGEATAKEKPWQRRSQSEGEATVKKKQRQQKKE